MTIVDLIKLAKENDVLAEINILMGDKAMYTSLISIDSEKEGFTFTQDFVMTFEEIERVKYDAYSRKFIKAIKVVRHSREFMNEAKKIIKEDILRREKNA